MNRVAFPTYDFSMQSDSLFFDLSGNNFHENQSVCMISQHVDFCHSRSNNINFVSARANDAICVSSLHGAMCEDWECYCCDGSGRYSLSDLHKLDDFEHFANNVARQYGFDCYERVVDEQQWCRKLGPMDVFSSSVLRVLRQHFRPEISGKFPGENFSPERHV